MNFTATLQNYKNSNSPADNTGNIAVNDSSWINLYSPMRLYTDL